MMNNKWIVVGSIPFQAFNGVTTYIGISKLGIFNTEEEAKECEKENFDRCGGMINHFEIE